TVKVIARKGKDEYTDEIKFQYQTEKWDKPAQMQLEKIKQEGDTATILVQLVDAKGVKCLDAQNHVEFLLQGDGVLLDDLGTSSGSRKVQAYNGRAIIKIKLNNGNSVAGVKSEGLKTVFLNL
ncbi:MAG: glycoside hydrolase family 2, partial [Bacteroidota bacterium]|nr:glycoside hydrolase family 2 [Bacteroidota bacterium]